MRIIKCHIENFGKWSDKTFDFSEGCNIFCEENGWGKSTLAAFIRIMFFGFANERKRDEIENERKKYMPWQGGVYGGQIIFEFRGLSYILSCIFDKNGKKDIMEIRDLETNLPSSDFSAGFMPGEEMFRIDREAFMQTVFISQADCETKLTSSMNAKMGNLELQKNNLGNYESANESLNDLLNKMSPTRKTGSIYKLAESIGKLQMQIWKEDSAKQSIDNLSLAKAEAEKKLQDLEIQKAEYLEKQKEIHDAKWEVLERAAQYSEYCENYKERLAEYQRVRNYFPISLPRLTELDEYLKKSSRLAEEKRSLEIYQLTQKEENLLKDARQENVKNSNVWIVGMAGGLLLFVLGIVGFVQKQNLGIIAVILALLVCLFSMFLKSRNEANIKVKNMELEQCKQLQQKKDFYQTAYKNYSNICNDIVLYIRKLGFTPSEDFQEQLLEIRQHLVECKKAYQEYQTATEKKESFEQTEKDMETVLKIKDSNEISGESLSEELNHILNEIDVCKSEITQIDVQLEDLKNREDEIEECRQELEHQEELYRESKAKYEYLKKTQLYLQKAKENFTAKYTAPIKAGFDKYYQLLTGNTSTEYQIDVNANLTAKIYGLQRDHRLLSAGYRTLTGFCMRMAFVEAMYPQSKPFLILDDPFVNLDEEKTQKGLELLKKIGEEYQVIYFTCHKSRA